MAIQVVFRGSFKMYYKNVYEEVCRKCKREGENKLVYLSGEGIKIKDLLENIGIPTLIIAFILINTNRHTITGDVPEMILRDGDCIEIFPKIVGG